jgi:hypothetical protein
MCADEGKPEGSVGEEVQGLGGFNSYSQPADLTIAGLRSCARKGVILEGRALSHFDLQHPDERRLVLLL